jgi:hypothetical protein
MRSFFLRFGGGLSLHNVLVLILRKLTVWITVPVLFECSFGFHFLALALAQVLSSQTPIRNWLVLKVKVNVKVMLWPTVSRPVCLGGKHPSGAHDRMCITVRQLRVCWCGAFSLTGLAFKIAAGPHSRVRVPRDSWLYFTVSDSRLPQLEGHVALNFLVLLTATRCFLSVRIRYEDNESNVCNQFVVIMNMAESPSPSNYLYKVPCKTAANSSFLSNFV